VNPETGQNRPGTIDGLSSGNFLSMKGRIIH
jgi:hypothetical protein